MKSYRAYLEKTLSKETGRTYYNRLDILLEGQPLSLAKERLDISKILDNLSTIQYKNHFSQSKNALLYFLKWQNIQLSKTEQKRIAEMEKATHKKYRKLKSAKVKEIDSHIKHLKNPKLKLSYQTLLETGLRVSELSQITPQNVKVSQDIMVFSFIGKGGRQEQVAFSREDNPLLFERLKESVQKTPKNKRLFYSAIYLQIKAEELGITCHDLRRAFAKIEYNRTKSKDTVRKKLRHSKIKTTNIYIRSKIKL